MPIHTPDQRLRVFVSSTMQELAAERVAVRAAIERLRLTPVLFELGARAYESQDDRDSADRVLREALQHAANVGSHETTARALDALAAVAVADGDPDRAAQLLGTAEGIRRSAAAAVFPTDRASTARTRASVANLLGEAESTARIEAEARRPLADLLASAVRGRPCQARSKEDP